MLFDERAQVNLLSGQDFSEQRGELLVLFARGEVAGARVVDEKFIQRNAVGARENLRAQDVQPARAQRSGNLAEQPGAVPCADFDEVVAAVRLVQPCGHGREGAVAFEDQPVHEPVRKFQVVENFLHGVDFKITRRQRGEMSVQFLIVDLSGREFADFLHERLALFLPGAAEFRAVGQQRHRARIQLPEQRILEAVPQLVARALRIGERQQRQQVQVLRRLDLPREIFYHRDVVEVAPLREVRHEQMVFNDEVQRVRRRFVEVQALRRAHRHFRAGLGMGAFFFMARGFADIVQQQREVKQAGALKALKQRRVILIRRLLRLPDFVQLFEADQRVFVGGVLMIKFMLHEAGQLPEFGNVFAEQVDLVHRAQDWRDLAAPFEDGQESFADVLVVQKIAVHQRNLVADQLRQVGMQPQPPLLRMEKDAHEPARRITENAVGRGVDFPVDEFEAVQRLGFAAFRQISPQRKPSRLRDERHALLQRARDEENIPRVRVKVAHEFLDAPARRAVAVAEREGDGGLEIFPQHVHRAVHVVVQFRPHAQQKTVGILKLFALGFADEFLLLQFRQRPRAVFEKSHPQQVLEIAQAAAAVLDVRLLHRRGAAVFRAPRRLVFKPHRNIFPLKTGDAFRH